MPSLGDLWGLIRKVDRLLSLESVHNEVIAKLARRVEQLEQRMIELEHQIDLIGSEAKAAARAGAQDAMSGVLLEIGGRLQALEASLAASERVTRRAAKPE